MIAELNSQSHNQIAELHDAFRVFTDATASLEREYQLLRAQALELRGQLAEKQRALMASLERERELEIQALRQSRLAAMGEMAATLAHEVRNPLGGMELFTRLLIDELAEQPRSRRLAEQIARGIQDLNHLVGNILEYGRMPEPRLALTSVGGVIEEAFSVVGPSLQAGIRVEIPDARELHWWLDRALVTQVLLNLLRNAGEAMGDRGVLRVGVEADHRLLRIVVEDTGPGIEPERAATIFDPFFTTKERGTGLGLAVARAAVLAHGGDLTLEPSAQGARFVVSLPSSESAATPGRA
ncbi:MAG: ATP-binding protein [Candidatus Binatia bacterium]